MKTKNYSEILIEVTVDNINFQATWNPYEENSCILWCRDFRSRLTFTALGKFSGFNKRKVLDFIVKYCTTPDLKDSIEKKKFKQKLNNLTLNYFDHIELTSYRNKELAYRSLFSLDSASIAKDELKTRRKEMAKRFHPDAGGDNKAMTIINEAYDYLMALSER